MVDQIWVYGNSYESTLVAIVVPDKRHFMAWAKENGAGSDFKAACQKPEVGQIISQSFAPENIIIKVMAHDHRNCCCLRYEQGRSNNLLQEASPSC